MIHKVRVALCVVLLGTGMFGTGHAAGDPAKGRTKSLTCMGCHGIPSYTNVYPTYHVPKVAGQQEGYIVDALKGYKSGDRKHPTMQAQAATLSDEDMADIAAFFSSLK